MKLRTEDKRLTLQGNNALHKCGVKVKEIYDEFRKEGYSMEEVFYMISSAAHQSLLNEALRGNRK